MRVLVLATDVFGGTGGIAQYTRDFVAALASYREVRDVTVIPRIIAREPEALPPGVTYLSGAAGSKRKFVSTVLSAASSRPGFDWVVCGHINLLAVAHAAAAIRRSKVILLTYGIEVWQSPGRLAQLLVRRTDAVASISSFTLEKIGRWTSLPPGMTFLLPNAIDLSRYTPGPRNKTLADRWSLDGRRVMLTLGRMEAREQAKGFDEILDVMPGLLGDYPNLVSVMVGDGTDRPRLEKKSRDLGLENSVVFTGYIDEAEKIDCYRLAELFVMPSRLEGFGYVFLEALACGIPVIASKVDGSREAARDGALGILVDPSRPEELDAAIRSVLEEPVVPERRELDYFSWESFERRCHLAFDALSGA